MARLRIDNKELKVLKFKGSIWSLNWVSDATVTLTMHSFEQGYFSVSLEEQNRESEVLQPGCEAMCFCLAGNDKVLPLSVMNWKTMFSRDYYKPKDIIQEFGFNLDEGTVDKEVSAYLSREMRKLL